MNMAGEYTGNVQLVKGFDGETSHGVALNFMGGLETTIGDLEGIITTVTEILTEAMIMAMNPFAMMGPAGAMALGAADCLTGGAASDAVEATVEWMADQLQSIVSPIVEAILNALSSIGGLPLVPSIPPMFCETVWKHGSCAELTCSPEESLSTIVMTREDSMLCCGYKGCRWQGVWGAFPTTCCGGRQYNTCIKNTNWEAECRRDTPKCWPEKIRGAEARTTEKAHVKEMRTCCGNPTISGWKQDCFARKASCAQKCCGYKGCRWQGVWAAYPITCCNGSDYSTCRRENWRTSCPNKKPECMA